MKEEIIDAKCLDILFRYSRGLCTREEASEVITHHGDEIASRMLQEGFTTTYTGEKKLEVPPPEITSTSNK
jgi:hypothetical protein